MLYSKLNPLSYMIIGVRDLNDKTKDNDKNAKFNRLCKCYIYVVFVIKFRPLGVKRSISLF